MIGIEAFRSAAAAASDNAQLALSDNGTRITTRTGRVARWIGNIRRSANTRANTLFIQSLHSRFGATVADRLAGSNNLVRQAENGRPLRARQVREVLGQAQQASAAAPGRPEWAAVQPARAPVPVRHSPELAQAMRQSLDKGYVNRFMLRGDADCPNPMPDRMFLSNVRTFNTVMDNLQFRFPKLRTIAPPNLSQEWCSDAGIDRWGAYDVETSALQFANQHSTIWPIAFAREIALTTHAPRMSRFSDIVIHEFAHHLSLGKHSDQRHWLSRLAIMLQENGFIADESAVNISDSTDPEFALQVGPKVLIMGFGTYAATDAREFAAEALGWRMTDGYGGSRKIPRMPLYLENWVHECFPFTRDGPIPDPCVAFEQPANSELTTEVGEVA